MSKASTFLALIALPFVMPQTALAAGESAANAARANAMDYGPVLAHTIAVGGVKDSVLGDAVPKGLVIKLKDAGQVAGGACFDTMLCRWVGAWQADAGKPLLKLVGTAFDGSHSTFPRAQGPLFFHTGLVPGWAKDGKLDDPRANPYVPLPHDRARYRGLYLHGDSVVLRYTVQGTDVLEMPEYRTSAGWQWFDRILEIGPTPAPFTVVVCQVPATVKDPSQLAPDGMLEFSDGDPSVAGSRLTLGSFDAAEDAVAGHWRLVAGHACLEIPRLEKSTRIRISLWRGVSAQRPTREQWQKAIPASGSLPELASLTRGGPPRYPQPCISQGKLGAAGAAYVVDTISLPNENPWKAWMRPSGLDFFADGQSAAICTWSGDVWIVRGLDDKLGHLEWRRVATGLYQPLGVRIVNEQIFVLGRDQITRLNDLNGDGEADYYENFNNDVSCTPNYHEFAADLQTDAAGNFYFCKCSPLKNAFEWDKPGPHNGCMLRVSRDGSTLDVLATGFRAINGCGVGPHGEITNADNEGIWTPVSRLNWLGLSTAAVPAVPPFFGAMGMDHRAEPPTAYTPPLCWLPWGMDNSPGGQVWAGPNFGPLSGSLLHLSYGKCSLFQVLHEDAGGVMQGGVVRVPVTFASGIMRARVNPQDSQLYVCGLRGWQTSAALDGCLQRVRYAGQPFEIVTALHVRHDALELTASTPLDAATATDPGNWDIQWWNYRWTKSYGSDLYSVSDPAKSLGKRGQLTGEAAPIKSIRLSPDGKVLTVEIPGLMPVMQVMTRAHLKTAAGAPFKVEIGHTINKVP